jgi:hypothetical protein
VRGGALYHFQFLGFLALKPYKSWVRHLTKNDNYFIPSHLPSFIRRPPRDIGIPVFFDTRRFALVTPSARFHENDKPGPSFTAPPESPPNLHHLVHTYIYVYINRFTDKPAVPTQIPAPQLEATIFRFHPKNNIELAKCHHANIIALNLKLVEDCFHLHG